MEYDFDIEYRPGKRNHVDAFTRLDYAELTNIPEMEVKNIMPNKVPIIYDWEEIRRLQKADPEVMRLINTEGFYLASNGLCYNTREEPHREDALVVPTTMKKRIIQLYHDTPWTAHGGVSKTTQLIQNNFYWRGMRNDVGIYCQGCHSCYIHKTHPAIAPEMQVMTVPSCVWSMISLDIVGPLHRTSAGKQYLLTCMDYLSRYPECISIPDMRATTVAKAFVTQVITRHGAPHILLTDCGTQFISELFREVCKTLDIEKIQTSPYRPATNGVIERMHHVLKTMISHYLSDEYIEWDEMIPFVLMAYRSRIHEATRETPFFLLHGRDMELPFHTLTKPTRVKYDLDDNYVTEMK
ncbi:hypothetical protein Zmor_003679 [Zophobas morio]|uniref:RNA-directed DNA polymerase n=1 Tax=Zophobas morio TaxID=2755281 RepID=A0AA38HPI6_9CUCU|nr:hypothetical protein Zmor_003679 [Zophobas morio]